VRIIDASLDTIGEFGLCGYRNPETPSFKRKKAWLVRRFKEGMKLKILVSEKDGAVGSIEYMPGEHAWRAIEAPGYMVIHCLFIMKKAYKGRGHGSLLIEACEKDARKLKMLGVAVVASESTWMAKKEIYLGRGYELIDEAPPHYLLLAKRFRKNAPLPVFSGEWNKKLARYSRGLTILHSDQCPYVIKTMLEIPEVAREEFGIESRIIKLTNSRSVRSSPNPYGIFSIIWNGELVADHPISKTRFRNIMNRIMTT